MAVTLNANTSTGFIATSDTSGVLQLQTGGTTAVTVDASQNVGIGTSSPAKQLDLAASNTGITTGDPLNTLRFTDTDTTSAAGQPMGRIEWYSSDADTAGVKAYIQAQSTDGSPDADMVFATNHVSGGGTAERMRIQYDGNVGIGTSSPSNILHVEKATASNAFIQSTNSLNTAFYGVGGAGSAYCWSGGAYPVVFGTSGTERARIDSSGNLLVGLTSQTSTAATFAVISSNNNGNAARIGLTSIGGSAGGGNYPQVGYNTAFTSTSQINYIGNDFASWIRFGTSGRIETFTAASGTAGNAISATTGPYVAQGGTSWTNSSDERLKDIIEPITGATNKVGQLRAVIGKFKTDPEDKRRSFLIAQDVQAVLPEAVDVSDPDSLGVQYTDVIPLLVAAIKEQQAIINSLTDRITALEGTTP